MNKKHTLGSICKELNLVTGSQDRPDINYLKFCLDVPEHYEQLKTKGLDIRAIDKKRLIPFSAVLYIFETVFNTPIA